MVARYGRLLAVGLAVILASHAGTSSVDLPPNSSTVTVITSTMPATGDSLFENPAEAATAVARAQNPDLVDPNATRMVVTYADATTVDLRVQIQAEAKGFCQWYGVSAQVQGGALQWSAQSALPCSP